MRTPTALGLLSGVGLLVAALAGEGCGLDSEGNFPSDPSGGDPTSTSTSGSAGAGGAGGSSTTTAGGNTSSGGGTGGATSSGGGSGGCVPTTEDCLNSLDDDCDGDTDCADSDCGSFSCEPLPTGASFVTDEQQQCNMGLIQVNVDSCDDCGCSVGFAGTCTHQAVLYDNGTCAGNGNQRLPVQVTGCTSGANITALMNDTVGAIANPVGRDDAQCGADDGSGVVRDASFCQLPSAGACAAAGEACVPTGRGLDCVMLSGDVDCDAPYTVKRLYFADTNATSCSCSCGGGEQFCPTDEHYHAHFNGVCTGAKFDVVGDGACHDTGLTTVNSLQNHPALFNADDAKCENQSAPSGNPAATTVCCTP